MVRTNFIFIDDYIEMVRGDTFAFAVEIKDQEDQGITLDSAVFACKQDLTEDTPYLFSKSLGDGITSAGDGVYNVRVAPEDTADAEAGKYFYDLQVSVNGDVFTILKGVLALDQDVIN